MVIQVAGTQHQQMTGMLIETTQQEQTFMEQLHNAGTLTVEQVKYIDKNQILIQESRDARGS